MIIYAIKRMHLNSGCEGDSSAAATKLWRALSLSAPFYSFFGSVLAATIEIEFLMPTMSLMRMWAPVKWTEF